MENKIKDVNKLRELIRTGEFLEKNYEDIIVRNKWIFDVESFAESEKVEKKIKPQLQTLKLKSDRKRDKFDSVMGFLRHLYNSVDSTENKIPTDSQQVFIVHGHDGKLIEEVKQCVTELGLSPIVLHEKPNGGKTIIEKLESYLGNCKCTIVLYTPCDLGKAQSEESLQSRARQNVVYEHGLFQGALGRKRVILLKKGDTQLPGDNDGVVYTSVDKPEWKEKLKSEIKNIDV